APKTKINGTLWQTVATKPARYLITQHSTCGSIGIADGKFTRNLSALLQGQAGVTDQPPIQNVVDFVILLFGFIQLHRFISSFLIQYRTEIQMLVFPVLDILTHLEHLYFTHHFIDRSETQRSHDFTQL